MSQRRAIVLAGGQGKRMRSRLPKVLHEICGRSMVWFVVEELRRCGIDDITLVVSNELAERPDVAQLGARCVVQTPPRGTGDAVRTAVEALPRRDDAVIIVANADMPLLDVPLFEELLGSISGSCVMALATARMGPASNFGRIARNAGGDVARIIEVRDAEPDELALEEMNVGVYAFSEKALRDVLPSLQCDNAQGEYYLTDTLELLRSQGALISAVTVDDIDRVRGVNDRVELAQAQVAMNRRLCEAHMRAGVTIVDPATTYLEPGIIIGEDAIIAPNTTLGGRTAVEGGALIGPNTRLYNAQVGARSRVRESVIVDSAVGADCEVGPFAHLRMGTVAENDVRVGNFVEMKNAQLADGVRAGHLSYLGDAEVGAKANIGAGTITCNYDGKRKHRTRIGAGAFIGSNSSLIAPLAVGEGALTGAGSVVTRDVADGARVAGNPARMLPTKV